VADPDFVKILTYDDAYVGFLLAFPDVSAALQRARGRLTPWALLDIMREFKRTRELVINGAGILPEYQRLGGNALLYYELERTAKSRDFSHADLTQVAETTELMQSDLERLGARVYKRHRIYEMEL
jgi:ribosomal protein S18 acetylase RimI-like enzyme